MKKTFISIMAAASVLAGCEKKTLDHNGYGEFYIGGMAVEQGMNDEDIDLGSGEQPAVKSSAIDGMTEEELNAFIRTFRISLVADTPDGYSREWASFDEIDGKPVEVPAGIYTLTANSPETAPAAWNQPVFSGSTLVPVQVGQMTAATVDCKIMNMAVTVKCSEDFMKKVDDGFEIRVVSKNDESAFLVWTSDMFDAATGELTVDKEGWFDVADLDVYVTGRWTLDGQPHDIDQLVATLKDCKARDRIIMTVNAQPTGAIGKDEGIKITVDGSVNDKVVELPPVGGVDWEEVPDLPVDPEEPGKEAPSMTWEGNESFAPMPLAEDMTGKVKITIDAPAGIESFTVEVDSEKLSPMISGMNGGSPVMDLINPTDGLYELLSSPEINIPMKDKVSGKKELLFDISSLAPMIYMLCQPEDDGMEHRFILKVKDSKDNVLDKTCTFVYNAPASK